MVDSTGRRNTPSLQSATLEWHAYVGTCTDTVHAEAEGNALRGLKELPTLADNV